MYFTLLCITLCYAICVHCRDEYDISDIDRMEIVSHEINKHKNQDLSWHLQRQEDFISSNTKENKTHTKHCKYSLAIVIDTSASIFLPLFGGKREYIEIIKSSLNGVFEKLQGYGIDLAIYSFATHAKQETDGYVNMQQQGAINVLKKIVGSGQNWKGNGSGIKFSENPHEILTNWEDALIKVHETSQHLDGGYVDFIIFITDGNPNTRNNVKLHGKTHISAALDQAHKMIEYGGKSQKDSQISPHTQSTTLNVSKTKIIPISVSYGASEEYVRALTCLPSPQIGQDYFQARSYDSLHTVLYHAIEKETCCASYRDKCGVCHGDSSTCEKTHFKTWSDIYVDEYLENSYDESSTVYDTQTLYVSVESLTQNDLEKSVSYAFYEDTYLIPSQERDIVTNSDKNYVKQYYGDLHDKNQHSFIPVIEKIVFCFSKYEKIIPYNRHSPSHTGCNTKNIDLYICTLYHEEELPRCVTSYGFIQHGNTEPFDQLTPQRIEQLYNFKWENADKTVFSFKARAFGLHSQSVRIDWKLAYKKHHTKAQSTGLRQRQHTKKNVNIRKKHEKFSIVTKKHHAYLETLDEYDFKDYIRPNGSFNGIFTNHYSTSEHLYTVGCIDQHKDESFDLSVHDTENGDDKDGISDDDDIYYDYSNYKCVFGKKKRLKNLAFHTVLLFSICLALVFFTCLANFVSRIMKHRKERIEKDYKSNRRSNKLSANSKSSATISKQINKSTNDVKNEENYTDNVIDFNLQNDNSVEKIDNYSEDEESYDNGGIIIYEEEKPSPIDRIIDFFASEETMADEQNSKFE